MLTLNLNQAIHGGDELHHHRDEVTVEVMIGTAEEEEETVVTTAVGIIPEVTIEILVVDRDSTIDDEAHLDMKIEGEDTAMTDEELEEVGMMTDEVGMMIEEAVMMTEEEAMIDEEEDMMIVGKLSTAEADIEEKKRDFFLKISLEKQQ